MSESYVLDQVSCFDRLQELKMKLRSLWQSSVIGICPYSRRRRRYKLVLM